MDSFIVCSCGSKLNRSDKYSVYGKDFCSMDCLKKFKIQKEEEMHRIEEERIAKLGINGGLQRFDDCCSGNAF